MSVRAEAGRGVRLLCAAIAMGPAVMVGSSIVSDFGWSLRAAGGTLGCVALYAVIVRVAFPTFAPRLDGRSWHPATTVVGLAVLGLLSVVLATGVPD